MKETILAYNKNAQKYAHKFENYKPYLEEISNWEKSLSAHSSILDLGCGPGINAALLSQAGHQVKGIDLSKEMITLAQKNSPQSSFSVSDLFSYQDYIKYDALLLSFVIVHLTNEEVERLCHLLPTFLKRNGFLYLSFMQGENSGYESASFSAEKLFYNYFDPQQIKNLLEENHFLLENEIVRDYEEPDGSLTKDYFQHYLYLGEK